MNITNNITNINMYGKLIPIKDYKGPILKLTAEDKANIEKIQENITQYTHEIVKLQKRRDKLPICALYDYYESQIHALEFQIEKAQLFIEDIKLNRINKQRAKSANKGLDING